MTVDAFLARRLVGLLATCGSAPASIFRRCHRFKVFRVDACSIAAKVINLKARWDGSAMSFVDKSVSVPPFSFIGKHAVSGWRLSSDPDPTAGFRIFDVLNGRQSQMVVTNIPMGLALDESSGAIVTTTKRCGLSAATLTQTKGDAIVWTRHSDLLHRSGCAVAGGVSAPPGFSLP